MSVVYSYFFQFYGTFRRHFRTQIAPEKNKNGFKYNNNNNWQRGQRWPPEPKVGVRALLAYKSKFNICNVKASNFRGLFCLYGWTDVDKKGQESHPEFRPGFLIDNHLLNNYLIYHHLFSIFKNQREKFNLYYELQPHYLSLGYGAKWHDQIIPKCDRAAKLSGHSEHHSVQHYSYCTKKNLHSLDKTVHPVARQTPSRGYV